MDQFIQINAVAITIILLAAFILVIVFRRLAGIYRKSEQFNIPDPMPLTGVDIPILGTYGMIKKLGFLSFLENNLNPRLTLYDDYLDYRVFASKNVDYSQIESVRRTSFLLINFIKINFHERAFALGVSFANLEIIRKIMDFFHSRGIPVINYP